MNMKSSYLFFPFFLLISCGSPINMEFVYSTSSEKALEEFRKGWVQIMDQGHYGAAEDSYRNALAYDPDFVIGKSVLARLTLDLERPWGSVVATPESPEEPEQLPGLIKPASRKDGPGRRKKQWQSKKCTSA